MSQPTDRSRRIDGADGLRAIACLWVFAHHLLQRMHDPVTSPWIQLLHEGHMGVPIFFVLSGLLLSVPFWRSYLADRPLPSLRRYAWRRVGRILPAYYLSLLTIFLLYHDWSGAELATLFTALAFVNSFHWQTYFPVQVNEALWSISVEMVFYVMLAAFAVGLFKLRRRVPATGFFLLVLACLVAGQTMLVSFVPSLAERGFTPEVYRYRVAADWLPRRNPVGLFGHFMMGIFAGWLMVRLAIRDHTTEPPRGPSRYIYDMISIILLAATVVVTVPAILAGLPQAWRIIPLLRNVEYAPMDFLWPTFPLLVALLLVALARSNHAGRCFDNAFLVWTAKLSYGIYLWHLPALHWLEPYWPSLAHASWNTVLSFGCAALVLTYAIAAASYYALEKPVIDWVNRRTADPARSAPQPPGPTPLPAPTAM